MWIWIIIGGIAVVLFLWGIMAGTHREDDYDAQIQAIEEWNKEHGKEK
jgi:nitrogen fixation-related uncharacterized protein